MLLALPVCWHFWLKFQVSTFRTELVARGEKMEVMEIAPLPPVGQNGAATFMNAANQLQDMPFELWIERMKHTGPGRARIASKGIEIFPETWQRSKKTNLWPAFGAMIETNESALSAIRSAVESSTLHFDADFGAAPNLNFVHLRSLLNASRHLSWAVLWRLRQGQYAAAWENLHAGARLCQIYSGEPWLIPQLVRYSMAAQATSATWEALQHESWNDEQLMQLQVAWQSTSFLHDAAKAFEMERALLKTSAGLARDDYFANSLSLNGPTAPTESSFIELVDRVAKLTVDPKEGWEEFCNRYPRYWVWKWWGSYGEDLRLLQTWQDAIGTFRRAAKSRELAAELRGFDKRHPKPKHDDDDDGANKFSVGYARASFNGLEMVATAETERVMLVTALALKRFHLRRHRLPATLHELVPEFLPVIPVDWMNGQPLRYRPNPDGTFLLYSVGSDGKDGGGQGDGLGSRGVLNHGRDKVWPMPATEEDLKGETNGT
ncbi:MAG: hypothetical protein AB1705_14055 [Verrucomicrobiota bacterium]